MTIDFNARYTLHSDSAAGLVLREKLWPRLLLFVLCESFPLLVLFDLLQDSTLDVRLKFSFAAFLLTLMAFGLAQLMVAGSIEVIDQQRVIKYRGWGRKFHWRPLAVDFSSVWYIQIKQVPRGRGWNNIHEVSLRRRDKPDLLIDRSDGGDHADTIALALQKHTGLPLDSLLLP